MGKDSTKPEMIAKMNVFTVTTQNDLVNLNNFLGLKQQISETVRLFGPPNGRGKNLQLHPTNIG